MKQPEKHPSAEKENRKAQSGKQGENNPVREDEANSIRDMGVDKSAYPYKNDETKQFDTQPEFIDRDSDSKDKS